MTIYNTAGTTSPANTPFHLVVAFVPGEVPSGSIAVPQEGGVDVPYQAEIFGTYGDGSLYLVKFYFVRAAGIAGNGSQQITFAVRTGSYSNTSSITTADITGERDFKLVLSNVHNAWAGTTSSGLGTTQTMAVTLNGSGGVSGGKALYPSNLTIGTTAVVGGGGTGGQISVSGGVVTVVSAGTGYGFITTSATRNCNDIISEVNATGNRTNGVEIVQYAKGRFVDAWRVRALISSINHYHVTFYVERWKKPDGTLLQYRRTVVGGTGWVDTATRITNLTYDADFKDGSTIIVGANGGDTRFQSIHNYIGGSFAALDSDANMYWESNGTAFNAIVPLLSATEAAYWKRSKIALPWIDGVPGNTIPTTHATYEQTSNGGLAVVCDYTPFGCAGIRSPLGSGGGGSEENPMNTVDMLLYEAQVNGNLSNALVWRKNANVSCAHALGFPQLGSGYFEKTTMYPANVLPTSVHTFTGMTPTREATTAVAQTYTGFSHPLIGGTIIDPLSAVGETYHHVGVVFGPCITVGDQWMIDALENSATTQLWGRNPTSRRQATVGSTTYYGITASQANNRRVPAWAIRTASQAMRAMRPTWADGSANVVRDYIDYTNRQHFSFLLDLMSFIGTVTIGAGGFSSASKTVDYTGTGAYPEVFTSTTFGGGSDFINPFMDVYEMMVCAQAYAHHKGTPLGDILYNWLNYRKLYWVKQFQGANTPLYGKIGYYISNYDHVQPNPSVADTSWGALDATNPGFCLAPFGVNSPSIVTGMTFTNSSSTVAIVDSGGVRWNGTVMATGSRIRLTNATNEGGTGVPPPAFSLSTWYYWLQNAGDPGHGKLCTGLIGGNINTPDPATAVTANSTPSDSVSFWFVPNNSVPGNNVRGWYNNPGGDGTSESRPATYLGATRMLKAAGIPQDTVDMDSAISNLLAVMAADGGNYFSTVGSTGPQYALDETYG
jgi:hypothetical protein